MPNIIKETSSGTAVYPISDELISQRKLFLTEEVNAATMNALLQQLMYLDLSEPGKEITLYINSPGGECLSGLAVADYIKKMKSPVRTVCTGMAASMGAILFLCGKRREMLAHTKLMIHDPSTHNSFSGMKPHEIEEQLAMLREMQDVLCGMISDVTGKSTDDIRKVTKNDSYFSLDKAVEFGLATGEYNR